MTEFDEAIALSDPGQGGEAPGGELTRTAHLPEGWLIGGAINGGVLMALGVRAMSEALAADGGGADVLAFTAHFLSASQAGPATVTPEVLRVGRTMSTAQASIHQRDEGKCPVERVRMMATFGDLAAFSEPVHRQQPPPVLPPPDQCISASDGPREMLETIRILSRLDIRLDPATAGFGLGAPSLEGELRGWIRFIDGREPDLLSQPFVVDAFPPVAFDLGAMGWAPTIEFTGHVRALPAPGWLRVRLTTTNVAGGLMEEDCVVWDSTDRVVAQSRQLAGVRMPSA